MKGLPSDYHHAAHGDPRILKRLVVPAAYRASIIFIMTGLMAIGVPGCASVSSQPSSEASTFDLSDTRSALLDEYNAKVQRCRRSGGFVVLQMGSGGRIDRSTMEKVTCARKEQSLAGFLN